MSETKELLRRGVGEFEPMPDAFDRVIGRRDRKRRNQRIAAGVLGIAVFAIALIGLVRLVGSERTPADEPSPTGTVDPIAEGQPLWPQTSLEEVRQAQELADAGDPAYTWQVDRMLYRELCCGFDGAVIFDRFVEEELGWEEFLGTDAPDLGDVLYVRCAPGETNPVYPNDPVAGACAPTIDGRRYETVRIVAEQVGRQDGTGIWVVTDWETVEPFEQVIPPPDAETTSLLEAFVQARVDGAGAEQHFDVTAGGDESDEIPFLYAAPSGVPYERAEFEIADGPLWPDGRMRFAVRLFAGDETVVEQFFRMDLPERGLWYEDQTTAPDGSDGPGTTVNGQVAPVPYIVLGGEVTFLANYPWRAGTSDYERTRFNLMTDEFETAIQLLGTGSLRTGCTGGSPPADAEELARRIRSNPDLQATSPVETTVGGMPALRMDVTATLNICPQDVAPLVTEIAVFRPIRIRLYLVDLPEGASAPILAIGTGAQKESFERAVESAAPIVDSIEFDTP